MLIRKNSNLAVTAILLLTLAGIFIGYYFFFRGAETAEAWHETGWLYRQGVPITNTGAELTDYQVAVTIDTAQLISDGKMQSDCGDVRFAGKSGKELPYWMEFDDINFNSYCNSTSTKFWVKIDRVPVNTASTTPVVYMYYGNPNADNGQNGNETFMFFDDFDNGLSKWNTYKKASSTVTMDVFSDSNAGSVAIQGDGTVKLDVLGDSVHFAAVGISSQKSDFTNGFSVEARRKQTGLANYMNIGFGDTGFRPEQINSWYHLYDTVMSNGYHWFGYTPGFSAVNRLFSDGTAALASILATDVTDPPHNQYNRWQLRYDSSGGLWAYYNDTFTASATDTAYLSSEKSIYFSQGSAANNQPDQLIDWVFVRKFSYPEPAMGTVQSEEKSKDPVGYWSFDEGYGTIVGDSAQNNDGAITGATWKNEDECVKGKCLYFDGSGDIVTVANSVASSTLNFGTGDFTLSTWVRSTTSTIPEGYMSIIAKGTSPGYSLFSQITTGQLRVWVDGTLKVGNKNFMDGVWHHLTVARNGDNLTFYIDGTQDATASGYTGKTATDPTKDLTIGSNTNSFYPFFGYLDEVRIYPYARTASEIKADYASSQNKGVTANIGEKEQTLNDGLVGHWKMDESSWNGTAGEVVDSSGAGNNGQAVGAGGITGTSSTAKYGRAGEFDGTDDYVNLGAASTNFDNRNKSYTIGGWVKLNESNPAEPIPIIGQGAVLAANYWVNGGLMQLTATNMISFIHYDGSAYQILSSTSQTIGTWFHILGVYDISTKKMKIYINGVLDSEASNKTPANYSSAGAWYLGYSGSTSTAFDDYFNGLIDDVRIYNRALSVSEVARLYEDSPPPIAYFKFDEGTGQTVNNSASSTISGTLGATSGASTDDPTWKSSAECRYGGCLNFDGTTDYVYMSSAQNLGTVNTLSVWAKGNTDAKTLFGGVAGKLDIVGYYGSNALQYYVNASSGAIWAYTISDATTWHHYSFSRNGSNVTCYVDGVSKGTVALSGASDDTIIRIIGAEASGGYFWKGSIDDVRIYNYARTQKQILEDMQAGAPVQSVRAENNIPSGLMGYWKFDDVQMASSSDYTSTRFITSDSSGRGNNAEVYNATSTPGKFGKALGFDGTSDYGIISDSVIDSSGVYSYSVWARANSWVVDDSIFGDYVSANQGSLIYVGSSICLYISSVNNVCIEFPSVGVWHHYVVVDDNTKAYFYIDGVLKGKTVSNTTDGSNFGIGAHASFNTTSFNGNIDEIKLYNIALSAEDILKDYNQGKVLKVAPAENPTTTGAASGMHPGGEAPVMHLTFDEGTGTTSTDRSGNGNDGGFAEGAGAPTWRDADKCKKGKCLEFDGADDKVIVPDSTTTQLTTDGTVSVWVNPTSYAGPSYNYTGLVCKGNIVASRNAYCLYYDGPNASVGMTFQDSNSAVWYLISWSYTPLNQWTHIVYTWTGNMAYSYINGKYIGSQSIANNIPSTAGYTMELGHLNDHALSYLQGKLDDVKIWNRALSAAEVAYEYNGGKPVGHWKFDEGHGDYAYDASGNGNTGTVVIGTGGGNTTTSTAWSDGAAGKINGSLDFDGTDDRVLVRNESNFDFEYNQSFSGCAWVKPDDLSATENFVISKLLESSPYTGWEFSLYDGTASTGLQLYLINSYVGGVGTYISTFSASHIITQSVWQHICFTYSGSGTAAGVKFYLNGVEQKKGSPASAEDALGSNTILNNQPVTIGMRGVSALHRYEGAIDDVRVYGYMLNASQIKQVYNNSKSLYFK
jgi:hypothetical protein